MTRGSPTDLDLVERILVEYTANGSIRKVGRKLGIAESTIRGIIRSNPDRFAHYRDVKRLEFIDKAWEAEEVLLARLTRLAREESSLKEVAIAFGIVADKAIAASGNGSQSTLSINQVSQTISGADIAAAVRKAEEDGIIEREPNGRGHRLTPEHSALE